MQHCQVCQQTKAEQRRPAGLMRQRVVERPWQVPFMRSTIRFEYILVFQNLLSRWVEGILIKKANSKMILRELKNRVILRFGTPEVFLPDNGTEFKNRC